MDEPTPFSQKISSLGKSITSEKWRRYGEARRAYLLEKDEMEGGTSFFLNKKCRIQRYFQLSERVTTQFREMTENERKIEDAYVMGHRLMTFLSVALPKHPEYMSPVVATLRDKSFQDLVWIRKRLDLIALQIDEEQLNKYITDDFVPDPDEDSSTSSDVEASQDQGYGWENFTGWTFDLSSDDMSTQDVSYNSSEMDTSRESSDEEVTMVSPSEPINGQIIIPALSRIELDSDDEYTEEEEQHPKRYYFESSGEMKSTFLKRIMNEEVRYETDSEAVDSWAQDGDSAVLSASSGHGCVTYDAARVAFHEIMNRVPLLLRSSSREDTSTGPKESSELVADTSESNRMQTVCEIGEENSRDSSDFTHEDDSKCSGKCDDRDFREKENQGGPLDPPRHSQESKETKKSANLFNPTKDEDIFDDQEWVSFDSDVSPPTRTVPFNFRSLTPIPGASFGARLGI